MLFKSNTVNLSINYSFQNILIIKPRYVCRGEIHGVSGFYYLH